MRRITYKIQPHQNGMQVEMLLRREWHLSAAAVRRAKTQQDGLLLDGQPVFTTAMVRVGQTLSAAVGDLKGNPAIEPVPGPMALYYEDEDLLVIDKPGGMPVHPSQGHHGDTLANLLMAYYESIGLTAAFHPVNRLDRGTSGLMAVAKHSYAHERLQQQLQTGQLSRVYLAVCEGIPAPLSGQVDGPIGREPGSVIRRRVDPAGSVACTRYEVLDTGRGRSLVRLMLDTGRTHQIRVHMAQLGCPVAGDFLYGREIPELPHRFALHSETIRLEQPLTGQIIRLDCPLPEKLAGLLHE